MHVRRHRRDDTGGGTEGEFREVAIDHDRATHIFRQPNPRPCRRFFGIPSRTPAQRAVPSYWVAQVCLRRLDTHAAFVDRPRYLVRRQPTACFSCNYKSCTTSREGKTRRRDSAISRSVQETRQNDVGPVLVADRNVRCRRCARGRCSVGIARREAPMRPMPSNRMIDRTVCQRACARRQTAGHRGH